jgi:ATP-dependent DNA helicase RecQ
MECVQAYCLEHNIQPPSALPKPVRDPEMVPEKKPRYIEVGELYNQGLSVAQIMARYSVQQGTVIDHLNRFVLDGEALNGSDRLPASTLSPSQQEQARMTFARLGTRALRPVFDDLGGAISFDDLKVLRLRYLIDIQSDGFPT